MQFQSVQNQSTQVSVLSQLDNTIQSSKQSQKQLLKKQIQILNRQVNKLKIGLVNQKIHCEDGRKLIGNNQKLNNQQEKQSYNVQILVCKQINLNQITQPIVNFRVGRIVKNKRQYSNKKETIHKSRTIQVRKKTNSYFLVHSKEQNSRYGSQVTHQQIEQEQFFQTLQSRQKCQQGYDMLPVQKRRQKHTDNLLGVRPDIIKTDKLQQDCTKSIQSSQLTLKSDLSVLNYLSMLQNSDAKTKRHFGRKKHLNVPQQSYAITDSGTDTLGMMLTNPQCSSDFEVLNNMNFKRAESNPKNQKNQGSGLQEEQFFHNFLNLQSKYQDKNNHIQRYKLNQRNRHFQTPKQIVGKNRSFKSRILSKGKTMRDQEQEQERKLGKIMKNLGSKPFDDQYLLEGSQDYIQDKQIPNKDFSVYQMPFISDRPHSKSNQEEIIQMVLRVCKKLKFPLQRDQLQGIVIKKFKNCLVFRVPQTSLKFVWHYQGKLYLGQGQKEGQEGYKSGYGIQYFPQKSFYKGKYSQDKRHGLGIMINQRGDIYQGLWKAGQKDGNGKFFDSSRSYVYQGQFKQGRFDGFGILKNSQEQIYKGTFSRGIKHGLGFENFKNGDQYKGRYQLGKFRGKGKYTWSNGNVYLGEFVKGVRTGPGKWKSAKQGGDTYIGRYQNEKKHGVGKYCWPDGSFFQGHFQNDEKHGQGILQYADGKKVHGRWEKNKLVEVINPDNFTHQKDIIIGKSSGDIVKLTLQP